MVKLMVLFFKKFLETKESDMSVQLMLHDSRGINESINFWHNLTKIPKQNFIKPFCSISRSSQKKRNKRLKFGTIHVRIYDVNKFFRLIGWIDGLKAKFNI
jgi:hypothetical protein